IRRAAKAEILPRFRMLDAGQIDVKSRADDLVTVADIEAEAMITRGLQRLFPSALVIGEEAVAKKPELLDQIAEAELCFIIDPVDGTWNFAHGLGLFGTTVAMCRLGRPAMGLIYDPTADDMFICDIERPSVLRRPTGPERPLNTATQKAGLSDIQGYAHIRLMSPAQREIAYPKCAALGLISNLRCSAHEYRLLTQGAVDFVMSSMLNPWDHVAGSLLCRMAGGHSAMLDGSDYLGSTREGILLSASNEATWDMLAAHFVDLMEVA
ncbi:MAG: inositol monophosphatase, partial [Pseudomonadota bacterium]